MSTKMTYQLFMADIDDMRSRECIKNLYDLIFNEKDKIVEL